MLGDAKTDIFIILENQACTTLCRRASNASPVVLPVATVQVVIDDEQRPLALACNVLQSSSVFTLNIKTNSFVSSKFEISSNVCLKGNATFSS